MAFNFTQTSSSNPGYKPVQFQQYNGYKPLDELNKNVKPTDFNAWAAMKTQSQQLGEQNLLGQHAQQTQGAWAGARSGLAAHGGMGGGSRELLAQGALGQQVGGAQNIRLEGQGARIGIGSELASKNAAEQGRTQGIWANLASDQSRRDLGQYIANSNLDIENQRFANAASAAQRQAEAEAEAQRGGLTPEEYAQLKNGLGNQTTQVAQGIQAISNDTPWWMNPFD